MTIIDICITSEMDPSSWQMKVYLILAKDMTYSTFLLKNGTSNLECTQKTSKSKTICFILQKIHGNRVSDVTYQTTQSPEITFRINRGLIKMLPWFKTFMRFILKEGLYHHKIICLIPQTSSLKTTPSQCNWCILILGTLRRSPEK